MKLFYVMQSICLCVLGSLMIGCGERSDNAPDPLSHYKGQDFVSATEAEAIAQQFVGSLRSGAGEVKLAATDLELLKHKGKYPNFYIFDVEPKGFVIVSASEVGHTILGYSTESDFELGEDIPDQITSFLKGYTKEIETMRATLPEEWTSSALRADRVTPEGRIVVDKLLKDICWNQYNPYNALVPEKCPIGCVATATAQIIRYWKYPNMGYGSHSYQHKRYGRLGVSYQYPIDWRRIPDLVDSTKEPDYYSELSRLCYDVAVGLDMDFYNAYSGAHIAAVPRLLSQHYNYSATVRKVSKKDYSNEEWEKMIRAELDAKRPILYSGYANAQVAGHAFICDGYSDTGEYHMNWGWGCNGNGWFKLDALALGSENYNYGQEAIIGIEPPAFTTRPQVNVPSVPNYPVVRAHKVGYIYIRSTSFNGILTSSGASDYTAYIDRPLALPVGKSFPYEVEVGRAYGNGEVYLHIYVDLDQDSNFYSSGEEVLKVKSENGKFSGTITLPSSMKDQPCRMRVILSMEEVTDVNKELNYGEVEDYTIEPKK